MKYSLRKIGLLVISLSTLISAQILSKKYEPIEGKIIGIWPHENKLRSPEKLRELRENCGFNYLLVAAPYGDFWYESIKASGYDNDHIMKQIYYPDYSDRKEWFWNNISSLGKVWAYYFDEPISREFPQVGYLKMMSEFCDKGYYPNGKFVLGEINEYRAKILLPIVDEISYTGYGGRDKFGLDQINSWKEWKVVLGEKLSMLWFGAHEDSSEFKTLFKAAKELGYNSIWLYQYEPLPADQEIPDYVIERFCEAAVEYGFMRYKK